MNGPCFVHPLICGWMDTWLFPPLATVNHAEKDIDVQVFVQVSAFHSFGFVPRSRISGSCQNSMFSFLLLFPFYIIKVL